MLNNNRVCGVALLLLLVVSACDSSSDNHANASATVPQTTSGGMAPPTSSRPWDPVTQAIQASTISDVRVLIGTRDGIVYEFEKGNMPANTAYRIASASKMLTGATLFRLIERGELALSNNPQDHIPWWTSDAKDPRSRITLEQLLSFVSGFNERPFTVGCTRNGALTIEECVRDIYSGGLDSTPGVEFHYGPEHMQIAALMAEYATGLSFPEIFESEIVHPLGLSPQTNFGVPSRTNARASNGAYASASDYFMFLRALFLGELINDPVAFSQERTQNAIFVYKPGANTPGVGDWRYALGAWRECDLSFFSGPCVTDIVISSPGAFGWTPWIDFKNGYYALIAHENMEGTEFIVASVESTRLEQTLQPLIENALAGN